MKHDAKECEIIAADNNPMHPNDDDNDDNDGFDDHVDGHDEDAPDSETNTLETIEPFGEIPRLQGIRSAKGGKHTEFVITDTPSTSVASIFEDKELTVERLRYLHAKFATKSKKQSTPIVISDDNAAKDTCLVPNKRKRSEAEVYYQHCEEAENMAVLSHIKKKASVESLRSCSGKGIDGGAGAPIPPLPI